MEASIQGLAVSGVDETIQEVWWEKDQHDETLWWKWTASRGWQRWKEPAATADGTTRKGWMTKMGVVLHKWTRGQPVETLPEPPNGPLMEP